MLFVILTGRGTFAVIEGRVAAASWQVLEQEAEFGTMEQLAAIERPLPADIDGHGDEVFAMRAVCRGRWSR